MPKPRLLERRAQAMSAVRRQMRGLLASGRLPAPSGPVERGKTGRVRHEADIREDSCSRRFMVHKRQAPNRASENVVVLLTSSGSSHRPSFRKCMWIFHPTSIFISQRKILACSVKKHEMRLWCHIRRSATFMNSGFPISSGEL